MGESVSACLLVGDGGTEESSDVIGTKRRVLEVSDGTTEFRDGVYDCFYAINKSNFLSLGESFSLILLILILFLLTEFMVMLRESAMTSLWLETLFSKPGSAVMVEKQSSGCNA